MSLLMDALRRAERAKELGQPEQHGDGSTASTAADSASPNPAPSARTDPGGVTAAAPGGEAGLALSIDEVVPESPAPAAAVSRPGSGPQTTSSPRAATAGAATSDRATQLQARRMLAARSRQSRRRRLLVTAGSGVALLVIVLVLVYFEVVVSTGRLQGPRVLVPSAAPEGTASVPAPETTNTAAGKMPTRAPEEEPPAHTGSAPASRPGRPVAQVVSEPVVPVTRTEPAAPAAMEREIPASPVVIVRNEAEDPLQVLLAQAFDDYQAGNDARAEAGYRQALALDANNRDALLGLAALAQRGGRVEEARMYYRHLLELNPLDSAPAAGLIALQGGTSPVNDESRIKSLLRQEPDAAYLHFALGTVYVGQGRWAEAQQAFFDAYRRDPGNADHAFNLAVCLDRLGQSRAALEYYRRALDLARGRAAGFSASQAEQRIETLTKAERGDAG